MKNTIVAIRMGKKMNKCRKVIKVYKVFYADNKFLCCEGEIGRTSLITADNADEAFKKAMDGWNMEIDRYSRTAILDEDRRPCGLRYAVIAISKYWRNYP